MRFLSVALLFALVVAPALHATSARAEPTEITVRVLGKDSKFVGTSMGGVQITLRDAQTGEVLAKGVTAGGTGDTELLMHKDRGRRAQLSDDSAAKFSATLDLDTPRLIKAEAYGPLGQLQGVGHASSTQWVVPGKDVTGGDGWVLELPGFVVDVLSPPAHVRIPAGTSSVPVEANVVMMCGCPIEPDGLWDADAYEVKALIRHDGEPAGEVALSYAGETSQFKGEVPVDGPGVYEVTVFAYDPANGNTGLDRTTFIAKGEE
ncbi:hypothetical protein [Methyloligella solikamskensis]|uniref:Uncharacterized protein n=1 Tax=Methyloligella solikamskensis TaxID=1177756 RepID=A0ABW3J805_9HYPH